MSKAYMKGVEARRIGKSIYFNPYRHKGSSDEYFDFIKGYNSTK